MGPGVAAKILRRCVAYRRYILAGSRPGGGGTLVLAKVPKAICACAIARKNSGCPSRLGRLRGSRQGTFPVPGLDARNPFPRPFRPNFAFLGAWLGERRPKNTNTKDRFSSALGARLDQGAENLRSGWEVDVRRCEVKSAALAPGPRRMY
jgi:hypothetical protein